MQAGWIHLNKIPLSHGCCCCSC